MPARLATNLAWISLLALLPSAPAAGGLATHGVGSGILQTNDGLTTCPNAPVAVQVVYATGGPVLTTATDGCVGVVGFTHVCCQIAFNSSQNPPLKITYFCAGSEAGGLHCEGTSNGVLVTADVGPYAGPGSLVTLNVSGAYRFHGTFTAI
jgi:hypothetical protein